MPGRIEVSDIGTSLEDANLAVPVGPTIRGGVQGAVLVKGAAAWKFLNPGVAGQLLVSRGPGANVEWI